MYHIVLLKDYLAFRKEVVLRREHASRDELAELLDDLLLRWERDREETNRRLNRLAENQRNLDSRLLKVENSHVFRTIQKLSGYVRTCAAKAERHFRPGHTAADRDRVYRIWLQRQQEQSPGEIWFKELIGAFQYLPRFSLLLYLKQPDRELLRGAVNAVRSQVYPHWEMCVCDEAGSNEWVWRYFEDLATVDPRMRYVRSERSLGEATSLNHAAMLATGEYIACLGQHDLLRPEALFHFAAQLQQQRHELLYSDEDVVSDEDQRQRPSFKPDWSPELLLNSFYIGRFFFVSRQLMEGLDWFRDVHGAHLCDLALRASEIIAEREGGARHIAKVLYSRRGAGHQTVERAAHTTALREALQRRCVKASVEEAPRSGFVIRRKLSGTPLASIVICSRKPGLLKTCLRAIKNTTSYPRRETVVVQHRTGDDAAMDRLLATANCIRVSHAGAFDFAAMNNRGALAANGDVLIFLNDDVQPLRADWLKIMLAQAQQPEVGIVGAKLLYRSGAIQHAGIALGMIDGAGHPQRGTLAQGFWPWGDMTRNVTAVTGACLAIRRKVFEELGGFDLHFPVNYNDVDLCLRARQAGYEVIYEAAAVLRHLESKTRAQGITWQERELFHERWGHLIEKGDPYYNPNLTRTKEDCSLST